VSGVLASGVPFAIAEQPPSTDLRAMAGANLRRIVHT
jgi:hypothetical protein